MPIAASGTQKQESSMTRYYHHIFPKPPHHPSLHGSHGQLNSALLSPNGSLFGPDPQGQHQHARPQDHRQASSAALNVAVIGGHQDSQAAHLFGSHTPPSLLNLTSGMNSPLESHQRTSPSGYDLRDFSQRRSLQELHSNMNSPAPISPSCFSMFCAEDASRKSESPSRKRRRVSIASHNMMDLAGSPTSPPGRLWEPVSPEQRSVGQRRRNPSQRRMMTPPDRCATPRNNRRSPTIRPSSKCRELLPPLAWPSSSPGEQRSFQPLSQLPPRPPPPHHPAFHNLGHQAPPSPQGQGNPPPTGQQPLLLPNVSQVPVSIPLALPPHNLPIYSGPHIPVCTAPHLAPCNMSTAHTCANIQFQTCQVPPLPSCNIHLPHHHHTYPPLLHHHHHHHHHHHPLPMHGTGHSALPASQHHLLQPAQFISPQPFASQAQDGEMDLLSDHRAPTNFHALPPGALSTGSTIAPSPPLHLLQDTMMRSSPADFTSLNSYGSMRRLHQSRRMANRRWRGPPIPPAPASYPGFIFHFLAMLSNPSVPAYGQDIPSPETTEAENYEALLTLAERLGEAKPRGLLKAEIEQLPSYRFNAETHQSDQTSCVICMCDFEQRQLLRVLPCNHEFHAKCVDKWLKTNRTCPICRGDASEYFNQAE